MTGFIHNHYCVIYCLSLFPYTKWQLCCSHTTRLLVSRKLHNIISKHLGVDLTVFDDNIPLLSDTLHWDH